MRSTSSSDAAANDSTVGQRCTKRSQYAHPCCMRVCCRMTSLSQMRYGSWVSRHGSSRRFSAYQRSKSVVNEEGVNKLSQRNTNNYIFTKKTKNIEISPCKGSDYFRIIKKGSTNYHEGTQIIIFSQKKNEKHRDFSMQR